MCEQRQGGGERRDEGSWAPWHSTLSGVQWSDVFEGRGDVLL